MNLHRFKATKHLINLDKLKFFGTHDNVKIVDAGSSFGEFVMELSSVFSPSKIDMVCIEPSKRALKKLEDVLKNMSFASLGVLQGALAAKKKKVMFTEFVGVNGRFHQWGNIVGAYRKKAQGRKDFIKFNEYQVETITLDDLVKWYKNIHYFKMDIEGSEVSILKNVSRETMEKIDQLSLEYHYPESYEWCIDRLKELGFKTIIQRKEEIYAGR